MAERNVLIPIDGSNNSKRAFEFYLKQIKRSEDHLLLVHVQDHAHLPIISMHDPLTPPTAEWAKLITDQVLKSQKILEDYQIWCEQEKIPKKTILGSGKPGEVIVEKAKSHEANMIVMGSRGLNGVRRTFLGSVSDYVIHHTHLPVLVVPPSE